MALGKLLAVIGVVLVVIGLVVSYAPWLISWLDEAAIAEKSPTERPPDKNN